MRHSVALVRIDISEECFTSIISVKRFSELGIALALMAREAHCEEVITRWKESAS
jgi:hypothetical protein